MIEFGLIGRSLTHSFSERYFTKKFTDEGLDCRYSNFELASISELPIMLANNPNLLGLSVTIPYKQEIIPYLDELSFEARSVGAVNCVKIVEGRLIGHNTDVIGFKESLLTLLNGAFPTSALILGTGGASQAVQYVLTELGIEYQLVSRDVMKGNYTYDNIECETVFSHHLIINTTPIGMYPNVDVAPKIPYAYITPSHYLFDLIYNPTLTQFLDYGEQRGAHICNGEQMLKSQAEAAWQIWSK